VCAQHYGVTNPAAHDALADARATLRCYQLFVQERERILCETKWGA
jgi:DNA polymerase III epsilon subunit-like protein